MTGERTVIDGVKAAVRNPTSSAIPNRGNKYFRVFSSPDQTTFKFMQIAYFHSDHPNAVLIQYIGDSTLAVQFPHRNSKSTQQIYTRTQLSIIRDNGTASGSAHQVYQQQVLAGPLNVADQLASVPRNLEEVRNVRKEIQIV